ncbi:hypothetical protein BDN72DRAFT_842656 [Pluteus cervinus]|uniref:Uncharacterized protein n=1 Tax=Pluteus cervinus TaxID=181527 RepID=A0ACD3APS5_9AGAR|nr:hypothetical protein BDN72DRAFT_842656 [Pluteus cervinus]
MSHGWGVSNSAKGSTGNFGLKTSWDGLECGAAVDAALDGPAVAAPDDEEFLLLLRMWTAGLRGR